MHFMLNSGMLSSTFSGTIYAVDRGDMTGVAPIPEPSSVILLLPVSSAWAPGAGDYAARRHKSLISLHRRPQERDQHQPRYGVAFVRGHQ